MIQGQTKSQQDYFDTELDSSSSLKIFSQDRRLYFKKFVERSKVDESEEDSKASITGRVCETLLLEPELFDSRFYLSSILKPLTGKMADFVNALVNITLKNTDESGNVTKSFEEMATEARNTAQFEWKLPVILDKFIGKDPEILYKEKRTIQSKGLTVVTLQELQNSEKIVEELKTNEFISPIINLVNSDRYSIQNQLQIEGFEVDGLKLKGMIDKCVIDHKKKTITPYDLKVVWNLENFREDYYLFRRAYIQAYLYKEACLELKNRLNLEYYQVENLKFIVADSINYYNPVIYTLDSDDMEDAYNGFEYKGRKYPGVKTVIADLKFAKDQNIWRISRKNYESKGICNIKS